MKKTSTKITMTLLCVWLMALNVNATVVTWALSSARTPDVATDGSTWTAASQGILDGTTYLKHGSYAAGKSADGTAAAQKVAAYTTSSTFLAQNDNYYVEYIITPSSGYSVTVSNVVFDLGPGSTNAQKASFYYSTDGFATRTAIGGTNYTNASPKTWAATLVSDKLTGTEGTDRFTFSSLNITSSQSFKLRLYLWCTSNSASARNFSHSNVKITFTTTALPSCVTAGVSSNPVATSACVGGSATSMSVTATGSSPTYQWQYSPDNGTTAWTNVSDGTSANITYTGSTTATLGMTAATGAQSGYYRCKVDVSCDASTAYSNGALLTVNAATVAGTASATASSVSLGNSTTVSLSGSSGSIQWQQSVDNSTWTDISGATSSTLTTPIITAKTWFRANVGGNCSTAQSNAVSVDVSYPAVGDDNHDWNFSSGDWGAWVSGTSTGTLATTDMKYGIVNYATSAKPSGISTSTSGTYTKRIKFDKTLPTMDGNGKPTFYAIGFPVSGKGLLTLTYTSGSSTATGLINLRHFNYANSPKINSLTQLTSPLSTPNPNSTVTYSYDGTYGAGELILEQATATQGTNILEVKWEAGVNTAITSQPSTSGQSLTVNVSATALTVSAAGAGLSYQWYSSTDNANNTAGDDVAVGTNSNSYTPSTASAGTKYYYCVVTGAFGSPATVTSEVSGAVVVKIVPTLSLQTSSVVYNGSAQAATVNGSVAGTVSNVLYAGSATVPTNAGSYAITADFMPDDVANYVSVTGGSAGTFVISQATPTLSLASSSVSYNGSAQAATVNSSVSGTVSNVKYDGSATAPTAVGSYAVTADFAPTDATNYSSLTGASAGSFTISAPPSVNVVADANLSSYSTTSTTDVTVTSGELTIDADASVKTMTVKAGGKLTLAAGKTLTVAGAFTLQSDATGTGTFVDNGGTISAASTNVEQYLATGRNWYISSPISGATAAVFNPAGLSNLLYSYDEVHGSSVPWPAITSNATSLTVMKGYVANMASSGVVTFTGSLNTGAQEIGVTRTQSQTKAGFNLVGNPYPSYLDWSNVTKTNLLTTMWYRTKTSGDVYTFDTYNATGNLATSNGAKAVTNMIPPMQAFWVRVDGSPVTGTLSVSNAQRAHADNSSNTFKAKATIETQPVIRLQVSNGVNSDQALIYYNAGATNGFDSYDSPKLSNESASIPEIYTLAGSEQLVINGVNDATELALGFTTGQANNFTIKASQFANFAAGTQIILRDNMLNYEQDLTLADYNFYSDVTANNETRFTLLVKAPSVATGINANTNNNVWVSLNGNNQIVVNGATGETSVAVYNEVGQRILSQRLTASTKALGNFVPGVYMVTVTNAGKSATQKVIIK